MKRCAVIGVAEKLNKNFMSGWPIIWKKFISCAQNEAFFDYTDKLLKYQAGATSDTFLITVFSQINHKQKYIGLY